MLYTSTARFDTGRELSEDELFKLAPSIFARVAHESRSERFQPIPTIDIVRGLKKEGFSVVGAKQSGSRQADKADFTKHLLRIRRIEDDKKYSVGDNVLEMYLQNGNDGTSPYKLMAGFFRIRCMNSLVAHTSTVDEIKIRHTGDALGKVIEGTYSVLQSAETLLEAPDKWSGIQLDGRARLALAKGAQVMRYGDHDGELALNAPEAEQLLIPRRADDRGNDLWSTMNVIQENCMKGGQRTLRYDENGRRRRSTTHELKNIEGTVQFNKALWQLTEILGERLS